MKKFAPFLLILFMAVFSNCNNEEMDGLNNADLLALKGMEDSYFKAYEAIASLKVGVGSGMNDIQIGFYDTQFHMHLDNFNSFHGNYSHQNAHDDHSHNQNGMIMKGMMGFNHMDWDDGHHAKDHEVMDEIIHLHDQLELH
ncbi:hypothetical protein [Algoriphagus persicinus]|uniref:hypothetical protein n=1 Tax=Algoriphagus persicinus TaxID=3108754 RepID=UPI002B3F61BC|nr:hypothetical protein [Algoriphagus sp. E1-3-M2]MEB2784996.1 hypothetical protein [Algoriphagus sp. E1-3-M2]